MDSYSETKSPISSPGPELTDSESGFERDSGESEDQAVVRLQLGSLPYLYEPDAAPPGLPPPGQWPSRPIMFILS